MVGSSERQRKAAGPSIRKHAADAPADLAELKANLAGLKKVSTWQHIEKGG